MIGMSSSWLAVKGLSIRESIEKVFELGFELVEVGAAHKYENHAVETLMELRKKYPDKNNFLVSLFAYKALNMSHMPIQRCLCDFPRVSEAV